MSRKGRLLSSIYALFLAVPLSLYLVSDIEFQPVVNTSMSPTYMIGDLQVVKPVDARDLKIGDVVALKNSLNSEMVTHRIIAIEPLEEELLIQTRGDNNATIDQVSNLIPYVSQVKKVVGNAPRLGVLFDAIALPGIIYAILFVILIIVLVLVSAKIGRRGRR